MLVFGDHVRVRDPRRVLEEIRHALAVPAAAGLAGHMELVATFIHAGELAQGIADAEHASRGFDGPGGAGEGAMTLVRALGACVAASWDGREVERGVGLAATLGRARERARELSLQPLPERVELREPEGYAYYAVYPEAYLAAARASRSRASSIIGIRSIGTGLAAMVAAASGGEITTVRPHGDPFHREITVAPELVESWRRARAIAVVDEGPGLSGSSFGAVLDLLEHAGVPLAQIECYPGHAGELGPLAGDRQRARWERVTRRVVDADELLLRSGRLAAWLAELVGPLVAPLEDLSAGAWRAHLAADSELPPVVAFQERRKLLARTAHGTYLAKFAGLGARGDHALARARTLAAAGFTPEVAGLVHGFLVERWHDRRVPLAAIDRAQLVDHVGRYLGFRARAFPAPQGAPPERLAEMVRRNSELALGEAITVRPPNDAASHPIEVDGRMHAWEWVALAGGKLLKCDAVDHHAAHDLVGCQDVAWDLAGAEIELGLSHAELHRVIAIVEDVSARRVDPELLAFLRPCYLAFQLGRHALAAGSADEAEGARLRVAADRYAAHLRVAVAPHAR